MVVTSSRTRGTPRTVTSHPRSFEEFVLATGDRLYRTALLLCGDHHLAEDLTQTTFAKAYASWGRVRRSDNPVAYTWAILTRTWLSHRRLRRSDERPVAEPIEVVGESEDSSTRLDLIAALQRLGHDDRAVLVLRYYDDLGFAQVADLLGIGEATARKRCQRALTRLREVLPDLEITTREDPS